MCNATIMIPLRDGVHLATDLYLPEGDGPWPLILFRTPYGRTGLPQNPLYGNLSYWTEQGYIVCAQDIRGTGESEGALGLAGGNEFDDGEDVIRYLAEQPFCNGRIGMFGLSFPGYVQNAAMANAPKALKAVCPFMCPALHPFGAHQPHVLHMEHILWTYGQLTAHPERYLPDPALLPQVQQHAAGLMQALNALPLNACPAAAIPGVPLLAQYNAGVNGVGDPAYWQRMHMPIAFDKVEAAVLFGTGWLDAAREWTIDSYLAARRDGHAPVRLLIGPWAHDERLTGVIDGVDFGSEASGAAQDVQGMMRRWFDHYLKDQPEEPFPQRVRYFMRGSNTWHDDAEWPPAQSALRPFYLGEANRLTAAPAAAATLRYTADPDDPTPSAIQDDTGHSLTADWTRVSQRADVLFFQSEPLTEAVQVAGTVQVSLHAVTDVPDTDFVCRVLDIAPDGRQTALSVGMLRASTRNGGFQRDWITPGQPMRYAFAAGNLANCFLPGHRIGVQICSFLYPTCDRNLHTKAPIGQGDHGVPARQQLLIGGDQASCVYLPVLPA